MVTRTETEQILRQAPFIESQQKDLLDLAAGVRDVPITQPTQQIAGLDPLTQQARGVGAGLGQYQPLLQQGRTTVGSGLETLQGLGQGVGRTLRAGQGSVAGAIEDLGRSPAGLENLARAGGAFGASAGQFAGGPGYTAARFTGGPEYSAQQFAGGPGYAAQQFGGGPGYTAEGFDPSSISRFQNPFENQAVQQALADIRREGDIAANQQAAAAAQTGAFGGSRDILQRSELDRNVLEQQGRTAAQMRQAGCQNAAQQPLRMNNEERRLKHNLELKPNNKPLKTRSAGNKRKRNLERRPNNRLLKTRNADSKRRPSLARKLNSKPLKINSAGHKRKPSLALR